MENLYIGPTGSGKTTILLQKFTEIAENTHKTDHILVFTKNATSVSDWRTSVNLTSIGPLNIFTYFGFIQKEITENWGIIERRLGDEKPTLEPTFMTVETSHYIMSKLVEEARNRDGAFITINATAQQIAVQLIDSLNHASMNGLTFDQVHNRLMRWAASDHEKITVYQESLKIMKRFRRQCLETRCLDYSSIIDVYNNNLLPDPEYFRYLTGSYHYLIVDDLEKTIAAAQDMILKVMAEAKETHLSFNPEGGFTEFFGGSPKLAEETFFPICTKFHLANLYTASTESRELATALAARVREGKTLPPTNFIKAEIETDLRGDMLQKVAHEVDKLLEKGIPPGNIALIAPLIDKVMEFTLSTHFTKEGYTIANLTRTKRLLDEPYAQALITLAFLVNPSWKLELNFSSLLQTLSLILKLDPVRSALLAEEIFKNQLTLPDLDDAGLRARLGFNNSDKYDLFRDWVKEKQTESLGMDHFFQVVFGELLAPLGPTEKDILACRQIINSITKFEKVMQRFGSLDSRQLGENFIDMVLKGTLAAEVLYKPPSHAEQILIATPYTFLFSPYIKQVQYLFWLDTASESWFMSSTKELANPYIMSRQWREEDEWTDELDQNLRKEQLTSYLLSLLSKCTGGLYLANSYYNSRGFEQEGQLLEWLEPESAEVKTHD